MLQWVHLFYLLPSADLGLVSFGTTSPPTKVIDNSHPFEYEVLTFIYDLAEVVCLKPNSIRETDGVWRKFDE